MIAALDADIILYRACHGAVYKVDFEDGDGVQEYVDLERAIEGADELIKEWTELAGCTEKLCVLSSPVNFRKLIMPEYKANRAKTPKPYGLDEVRAHILDSYETLLYHGLEADDTIGVLVSAPDSEYIGVSIDKDFTTIAPGWIFNPTKDEKPWMNKEYNAWYDFHVQCLAGDSTDNYKGIPGIGPKKAEKILVGESGPKEVLAAYEDAGLSVEYCVEQCQMARILLHDMFDEITGEISLYDPRTLKKEWLNLQEIENKYCKS